MNPLPPAFVDGKPYVPSEEDRENCIWARIALVSLDIKDRKCSGSPNCASCPSHPQNRPRLMKGKPESQGEK
jgi:hypothetical protein